MSHFQFFTFLLLKFFLLKKYKICLMRHEYTCVHKYELIAARDSKNQTITFTHKSVQMLTLTIGRNVPHLEDRLLQGTAGVPGRF